MANNGAIFPWTATKEQAARLLAEDGASDAEISSQLDIGRRTLARWKESDLFQKRVEEYLEAYKKRVLSKSIALKERRIESYLKDFAATEAVLQERGAELDGEIGGGATGYICKDFKGKDADTPVYQFDAALFRERLKLREQLAKELGQWTEKTELTGKDGGPLTVQMLDEILSDTDSAANQE